MKRVLLFVTIFILFSPLFLPKKQLWYALEHAIRLDGAYVNNEKLKASPIMLSIRGADIIYDGIKIGHVDGIKIYPYLVYNRAEIDGAKFLLDKSLKATKATFTYSVLHPFLLEIEGDTLFGKILGYFDLKRRHLFLQIISPKRTGGLKRIFGKRLKRDGKGYYIEADI